MLEECLADEMRRPAAHPSNANIDVRFAEITRRKLGVGVGLMQDTNIAEAANIVEVVPGHRRAGHYARRRRGGEIV